MASDEYLSWWLDDCHDGLPVSGISTSGTSNMNDIGWTVFDSPYSGPSIKFYWMINNGFLSTFNKSFKTEKWYAEFQLGRLSSIVWQQVYKKWVEIFIML